jgi:PTS system sucrose-specific IIC component
MITHIRRKSMDYKKTATEVIAYIGGKDNIVSAAHCATRLRLVIADDSKVKKDELEQVDSVKGVFAAQGQLQIIIGTGTVNKVYEEFIAISGIESATKEDVKQAAAAKQNFFKRGFKTLGDIFVPIIPAIVASGLLMGLLEGLSNVWPSMTESGTYEIIHLFSNAAFVFLPILIAISAAKVFGGNLFLGAVIGMIMIHPSLINAWSVSGMNAADIPTSSAWFGLFDIRLVGYQGHVIPVIIAVWLMSVIEKKLHKIVPEIIDLFVTPLVTVLVTGYVTLTVIGPVFSSVENLVLSGAEFLIKLPLGIGGAVAAAFYAPTVVGGLHHMYNALEAGLLSKNGINTWMPIATAANVAQGAAALAVAIKTRNKKVKALALPASLSAFLGITEPAIFGVNIRYGKPFIAGCIGGAVGGLIAGVLQIGASAYGITGIFGFLITTGYTLQYAIVIIAASTIAFVISWALYKENNTVENTVQNYETATIVKNTVSNTNENTIESPMNGNLVKLSEVKDESFAKEMLGKGFAIIPSEGKVYAPFNGKADLVFETGHALGISSVTGEEMLIHVGIDTVKLEGKFYYPKISSGDVIKKGQLLLEFDLEKIKEAGYDVTTPVIITNSDDYTRFEIEDKKIVRAGEKVMVIK